MTTLARMMTIVACSMPLLLLAQTNNVMLPQDKGPDKIDVSGYPAPKQVAYKLFTTKCSKCHTVARPINTTMTGDEWERYVKRMIHKPSSGISDRQGKEIYEFLTFDQIARKDKNLKSFYPALNDQEIAKLKAQQQ